MSTIDNSKYTTPTHTVAIGVSAGGLEALEGFFNSVDDDLGCAYIVIQHLSPDFKSMMDQLLSKYTSMPIFQASDDQELKANSVYLVPAGKLLRVVDGVINLSEVPKANRINLPINAIFTNLAKESDLGLIGIILSGTGSDGCRGIVAIKEAGGLVIAQDPTEAQFDGMPQNAIATGAVDFVLVTESMPEYIKNYISHPLANAESETFKYHLSQNTDVLRKILILIQDLTGLDFKAYKESTVSRRIKHRISINNMVSLSEYWEYLQENETEIELVKQDLLIGVTRFFRDKDTWDKLKVEVIEPLVRETQASKTLRIWCAGCSTGEEAYSLAILFDVVCKELNMERDVKVFASDIDQTSINYAGNGVYPSSISEELPPHYLVTYFDQLTDGEYQVNKDLRAKVVFALHNMIEDPPFSNMDMVSCRNSLIYFQQPAQQKAMAFFHFALRKDGFLLLGSSESPGKFANYFPAVDATARIYQKKSDARTPIAQMSGTGLRRAGYELKSIPQFVDRINRRIVKPRNKNVGLLQLQEQYIPPTFIVNTKLQVVYTYGDTSLFTVKIRAGEVTNDVADILKTDIVGSVLSAAHEVIRDENKVLMRQAFEHDDQVYAINSFGFLDDANGDRFVAISFVPDSNFEEPSKNDKSSVYTPDEQMQQRIIDLETAYVECQRMYREALEDLDSTSEELQTSNEELMAANEELQSTNEELQSVNEELYTVNSEFQQKIVELIDTNNDLENLLNATDLAVLFLDSELNIRRYTRPIRRFINIMDFDLDRPFEDLSLKFKMEDIHEVVELVNKKSKSHYSEIEFDDNNKLEVSISPYSVGQINEGVVISIREKNYQ